MTESAIPAELSVPAFRMVGRYEMYDEIASGGMASVHFGRLLGAVGFARMVAIKHLHPHHSDDTEFESMFVDEARLASRIQHPNVAAPLDVVLEVGGEIFLVMEYIHGETLTALIKSARAASLRIPHGVSASIMSGALHGLQAAHEAVDETGQPLNIIHRDVSPQTIMVGVDGVARVLDFGVAKAAARSQSTRQGQFKGKLSYMSPEQMRSGPVDRRVDVLSAGIVLWEALTHKRLFKPDDAAAACSMILSAPILRPSVVNSEVSPALDHVVMKALERNPDKRFQTALEFADAIEEAIPLASHRKVGKWVERLCGKRLSQLAERVSDIERAGLSADPTKDVSEVLRSRRGLVPKSAEDSTGGSSVSQSDATRGRTHLSFVGSSGPGLLARHAARLREAWPYVVVVSVVLLLLGTLAVWRLLRTDSIAKAGAVPERNPPAATRPTAPPPMPPTAAAPAPVPAEATPDEDLVANPVPPQGGSEEIVPTRRGAKAKHGKISRATRASAKKNCNPPYTFDAQGIRRVKPYCL
jgi:serine/threonine protein kinase